jgi:hypothetical protein
MLMGARWNAGHRENLGRINKWGYLPSYNRTRHMLVICEIKEVCDGSCDPMNCAQVLNIDCLANIATMMQFQR